MEGGFRAWLAGLGRREMVALSLIGLAIAGGAGLWYIRSLPRPIETVELSQPVPGPSPTPAAVFVHVAGWVRSPGVYELQVGERVIDAIDRAGGPRRGADLNALNLAALVVDAQQVLVPRKAAEPSGVGGQVTAPGAEGNQKINLNLATAEDLETLPGIGEVLAQRILEHREANGPFTSVDELLEVSGIGEGRLEDIRDQVTV
jgi:competence protein ComEA